MELHKAAKNYFQHRLDLDLLAVDPVSQEVWRVKYDKVEGGYYLVLDVCLGESPDEWLEYLEARIITKQRGGKRLFKTLDAVASALQQIGQQKLPLRELELI